MTVLRAYLYRSPMDGRPLNEEEIEVGRLLEAVQEGVATSGRVLAHIGFSGLPALMAAEFLNAKPAGAYATQMAHGFFSQEGSTGLDINLIPRCSPAHGRRISATESHVRGDVEIQTLSPRLGRPPKNAMPVVPLRSPDFFAFGELRDYVLAQLGDARSAVLKARWGYDGVARTLESISREKIASMDRLVTRARVQQIEAGATKALFESPAIRTLLDKLGALESGSETPLEWKKIPAMDSWFSDTDIDGTFLSSLVSTVGDGVLDVVEIGGDKYLAPFTAKSLKDIERAVRDVLEQAAESQSTVEEGQEQVRSLMPERAQKYASLLWRTIGGDALQTAVGRDGIARISGYSLGVKAVVRAVLEETETPLHWSEIVVRVRERAVRDHAENSIKNAMTSVGLPLGRGTYGCRQHIPLSDEEILSLVDAAEEIVLASDPMRQWTNVAICKAIEKQGRAPVGGLTEYVLWASLRHAGTVLKDVKRGVWRSPGQQEAATRIRFHQTIVELLEEAGVPMTNQELKLALSERRGLGSFFQIQPRDPIIRIGDATWGLIERDLPIKPHQITAYLDLLLAKLHETGKGLHVSEVSGVLSAASVDTSWLDDPELMLTFARRNGSMRVTPSRYLVLPEWGDERRDLPASCAARDELPSTG